MMLQVKHFFEGFEYGVKNNVAAHPDRDTKYSVVKAAGATS